jgi:hypothetical protein
MDIIHRVHNKNNSGINETTLNESYVLSYTQGKNNFDNYYNVLTVFRDLFF